MILIPHTAQPISKDDLTASFEMRAWMESIESKVNPPSVLAADIADITANINVNDKYSGKRVWDSTNNRELRANGKLASDVWHVIDGSATVTPS
jgi:hypothetical protein